MTDRESSVQKSNLPYNNSQLLRRIAATLHLFVGHARFEAYMNVNDPSIYRTLQLYYPQLLTTYRIHV